MSPYHSTPRIKSGSVLISSILLVFLLASCALPGPAPLATSTPPGPTPLQPILDTPVITSVPPASAATDTSMPPTATPPPVNTETPTASPTVQVVPNTSGTAGSIVFAPGTTAGVVQSTVQAGQVLAYTLSASAGQTMVLIVNSPNADVTLAVFAPNGAMLLNSANKFTRWQTLLPATGLYTIQVIGGGIAETFTLTAKVAQVVNFAPGTSSITLTGTTINGFLQSYSFSAAAGQTMTASLNVPSTTAYIDIYGINSGTILSAATKANSWTGTLPQTQVYVIEVVPAGGHVVNYALTVSITSGGVPVPTPTTGPTPSTGTNIAFQTGTTQGSVSGTVQAGQVIVYTINAGAGLPMILDVTSTNSDVTLGVIQPDGVVLLNNSLKWNHWQWTLPETGIYKIQVVGGAVAENFTLTASIPVRASFAAGASTMTLTGSTVAGLPFSYVLACAANQTMTVNLTAAAGTHLAVFGVSSGTLLAPAANAITGTFILPKTEGYVVTVIPPAGQVVAYSLSITVTGSTSSPSTNISFTPGTTAGVVQGTIQPGQVISYTVTASQWQAMVLNLESPNFDVFLGVFGPNGSTIVPVSNHWVHWQGQLPLAGTYTIKVNGGATTENYTLTVKIAEQIHFALGQSSITLFGTTHNGYVHTYGLIANVGQTMTVTINQPATIGYVDVVSITQGALLLPAAKQTTWTGVLPVYGEYLVEVIPNGGQLMSYSLTIEIH